VAASFRRVLAPGASAGRTWPLEPIAGAREFQAGKDSVIPGIVVRDDSTLVLTLEEPLNIFPSLLALPLASVVPTPAPDLGATSSRPSRSATFPPFREAFCS
jgi:peptide/nickel transport system substrate-binding protein/oligopeptide transport system substrate-binding protein